MTESWIEVTRRIQFEAFKVLFFSLTISNSGTSNILDNICLVFKWINLPIYYYMRAFGPKIRTIHEIREANQFVCDMSPSIWALITGIIIRAGGSTVDTKSQLWKQHEESRARKGAFIFLFTAALSPLQAQSNRYSDHCQMSQNDENLYCA